MKRFLKTVLLFVLPVALLCALFGAALWKSGELRTNEDLESAYAAGEVRLLGLAYRDETRALKQHTASQRAAEVLVLSSSRGMQFRGGFFETDSFFNAGGALPYIPQALWFLQHMPEDALPLHLLLVLDQYFYNPDFGTENTVRDFYPYNYAATDRSYAFRRLFGDRLDGKYTLLQVLQTPADVAGMAAAGRGAGFYADGSYSYGTAVEHPEKSADWQFADTLSRIARGTSRFEWGDAPSAYDVQATQELLAFCAQKGIAVTAILPPYAPTVWQTMQQTGKYGYIAGIVPALQPTFVQYGFELFDYSDLPETTDEQYIDGFHGSDRVYADVCLHLAQDSSLLRDYFDTKKLQALFDGAGNPRTVALPDA